MDAALSVRTDLVTNGLSEAVNCSKSPCFRLKSGFPSISSRRGSWAAWLYPSWKRRQKNPARFPCQRHRWWSIVPLRRFAAIPGPPSEKSVRSRKYPSLGLRSRRIVPQSWPTQNPTSSESQYVWTDLFRDDYQSAAI